jgi:hypothetical protein
MAWYHTASGKRSLDEIANDTNLGVGRRIHEMRFVNGVPMDQALDAVDKSVNYLNKDQINAAYKKHINRTLSNGVEDPHEEAFMKSELTKTATVNFKKQKWYQEDPEQGNKDAMNAVLERGVHPDQYSRARDNGILHNEVVDFINIDKKNPYHRLNLHQYTNSRQNGASHEETIEAAKALSPGDFENYAFGISFGIPHNEIMEAKSNGANMFGYVAGRIEKVPHKDMIEATKAGFPTEIYSDARANTDATHKQLMEVANKYKDPIDFNFYLQNKLKGLSHDKSLRKLDPNYNPWNDLLKEATLKPGLDDWWETDPNEADIQQGQPSSNWFDDWNIAPTYINDDIGRDIEQDSGRGPAGTGDMSQAWRIFNTPSKTNQKVVQIQKRRNKFPDHFSINEISSLLGVSRQTIQKRIEIGKFPQADIVGTTTFRGDKGNLPALWHRDTIKKLVPLPDKLKENIKQEIIKVKATKEKCGKEFPRSQRLYIPENHFLGHDCCEEPWTCGLSVGHEGQHCDMSHSNQQQSCPNGGNPMYYDPSSYSWDDAPNPYIELLGKTSSKITDSEQEDAHEKGIDLPDYRYVRESGATHKETLDAHDKGINLKDYGYVREYAIHKEILDAVQKGINLNHYTYAREYGSTHNEIVDAHNKGIDLQKYAYAREFGATHKETLDANSKGIDLRNYSYARRHGANHNEILDTHEKGLDLNGYSHARYKGINHEKAIKEQLQDYNPYDEWFGKTSSAYTDSELEDARQKGIHVRNYNYAREYGATHNEILDANEKGLDVYHYAFARKNATHNETLDAHQKGLDLTGYAEVRQYATHNEAIDAHEKNIDLSDYAEVRQYATHNEAIDALQKSVNSYNYADARRHGATHNEAIDVHEKGIHVRNYGYARDHGATHNEAIDVLQKDIDLRNYAYARESGATHKETLDTHQKGIYLYDYAFARNHATHNEIVDAHAKGFNVDNYGTIRNYATHNEAIDARQKGINLHHYNYAREFGANHKETLDAHQKGFNVDDYGYIREYGTTHNEAIDTLQKGINLHYYTYARDNNATHNEILDAHEKSANLNDYGYAREYGATHNEAIDALQKGINLQNYNYARELGATHNEILDSNKQGINFNDYNYAREYGATHKETLDANKQGLNLIGYASARCHGATHNEAIEAYQKDIDLRNYSYARRHGANHKETLDAHQKGVGLVNYGNDRYKGITHEKAIRKQIQDYNPYDEWFK